MTTEAPAPARGEHRLSVLLRWRLTDAAAWALRAWRWMLAERAAARHRARQRRGRRDGR